MKFRLPLLLRIDGGSHLIDRVCCNRSRVRIINSVFDRVRLRVSLLLLLRPENSLTEIEKSVFAIGMIPWYLAPGRGNEEMEKT